MIEKIPTYYVIDHHSMWGWPKTRISLEDADIIFTWNDFTMKEDVLKWQASGKRVVVYEHGWNAIFDYEINKQFALADGYITLGNNSANSLVQYGIAENRVLVTGNPNFDNLKTREKKRNKIAVLYTALHWLKDRREFNNLKIKEIISVLGDYSNINLKTIPYSPIDIPEEVKTNWCSEIHFNKNLFKEIADGLGNYDIILTPKESTFDFIALLLGKKVFRISKEEEYRDLDDQHSRNILPYSRITPDLLSKESDVLVNLPDELIKSITIEEILRWAITL